MSDKHVKLIKSTAYTTFDMSTTDIDAQIKALQEQRKQANRVEARANLVKVVGNKNSTPEQLLDACYSFIGTHRLNSGTPRKKKEQVAPSQ